MESYKIENLTFKYPTSRNCVLDGVFLNINQGEFVTVCGPSGSGKSTLLRLLKPVLSPSGEKQGRIFFEGEDLSGIDIQMQARKIGFVMQSPDNQIVTDKVWHELAFGLESLGMKNSEIRVRVAEMASFFGIEDWFHKKTNDLSGGQKQLLNLASVMVMQPSVLILDEPTSQLDPIAAQEFLEAVSKINRELGVTVILSEHRLEDALAFSDKMVVMEKGNIIYCGKPCKAGLPLSERQSVMLLAMPAAMRVFAATEGTENSPVTVREGRSFLQGFTQNNAFLPVKREKTYTKDEVMILIKDVYFRYEKHSPDIVKALDIKVHKGELYSILGGNGSGKTTTLSLISGINKPYRGEIKITGEDAIIGVLPQNPQTLFVEKTVEKDLYEMLSDVKASKEEKKRLFNEIVMLCELQELLERHPYDLSGGEMQRAALAKVLLQKPTLLLLDEPTKGMDAHFKAKLAQILKTLQNEGVTIIMVSHDVEFCAKYADRCAMFFDGGIVSEDTPAAFFAGKSFYTTAANRMARGIIDGVVTTEDIILALGGRQEQENTFSKESKLYQNPTENSVRPRKKINITKMILGILFVIVGAILINDFSNKFEGWQAYAVDLGVLMSFAMAFNCLIPQKKLDGKLETLKKYKNHTKRRALIVGILTVLVIMPATALAGTYFLDDKKYYFISLLLIIETMIPFVFSFENRKVSTREIVVISVLCAIGVAGRIAFFMLPQFKPTAAVVIITGICFGAETGFLTGAVSAFVSNFYFSQGPWTPWQMFALAAVGFFAGIFFHRGAVHKTRGTLCIFGILVIMFVYGPIADLSALSYISAPTWAYIFSTWTLGMPFNLIHGASTAFFLYTCAPIMIEKLERIKQKYGILK